jgi:hypothetical protein
VLMPDVRGRLFVDAKNDNRAQKRHEKINVTDRFVHFTKNSQTRMRRDRPLDACPRCKSSNVHAVSPSLKGRIGAPSQRGLLVHLVLEPVIY